MLLKSGRVEPLPALEALLRALSPNVPQQRRLNGRKSCAARVRVVLLEVLTGKLSATVGSSGLYNYYVNANEAEEDLTAAALDQLLIVAGVLTPEEAAAKPSQAPGSAAAAAAAAAEAR